MTIDFAGLAQECLDSSDFQARVLEELQRRVGFEAAFFLTKDDEVSLTTIGLASDVAARLTDRAPIYAAELAPVKRAALSARGVAVDTEICGAQHVLKTRYSCEIAATVKGRHSLMAYVPWRGRVTAGLMLGRSAGNFSRREVAFVESLLPGLGVARAALGISPRRWTPPPLPHPPPAGLTERLLRGHRPRVLASVHTERGTIVVRDRDGFREMLTTDGGAELIWTRAALSDPTRSGWPYADLFHLAPALAKARSRALFIGSGGGVSLQQFAAHYPGILLDLVEHEPAVLKLAKEWFALSAVPNLTTHVADGASFVENAVPASWDLIIVDAFDARTSASPRLQRAALLALRRALRAGGAVAWNLIGSLASNGPVAALASSASRVFDTVRIVPVVDVREDYAADTLRNVVVVAA